MKLPNTALLKLFPYHWHVTALTIESGTQQMLNKHDADMNNINNLYTQPSSWFQNNLVKWWIWLGRVAHTCDTCIQVNEERR